MTGKTAFIFLLTATTVFAVPGAPGQTRELVTIFFTGNELGSMQPCGCSGGQLGGLDRRYAVLNAVGTRVICGTRIACTVGAAARAFGGIDDRVYCETLREHIIRLIKFLEFPINVSCRGYRYRP